jgi:hypothetical protein
MENYKNKLYFKEKNVKIKAHWKVSMNLSMTSVEYNHTTINKSSKNSKMTPNRIKNQI